MSPTESELDKLQMRIDMREAAEASLRWVHPKCDAALLAKNVLTLLDEVEELETTIATQACDIAEYQRALSSAPIEPEPHPYDSHAPRDYQ